MKGASKSSRVSILGSAMKVSVRVVMRRPVAAGPPSRQPLSVPYCSSPRFRGEGDRAKRGGGACLGLRSPSTILRMVPLPQKSGGGIPVARDAHPDRESGDGGGIRAEDARAERDRPRLPQLA